MNQKKHGDITFQIIVGQLTLLSQLAEAHIHVTVSINDVSKITCSGGLSKDGLTVTWNHPFLFTAPPSTSVEIAIFNLPEELTPEWDKQPLGNQVVTQVASLLESENAWKCEVFGLSVGPAILSITCRDTNVLTIPFEHDCLSSLTDYSWKLYNFGSQLSPMACISTKIEVDLARLDLCPVGHSDYTIVLNDLSVGLGMCHHQYGNIVDLKKAIQIQETWLLHCPLGHPKHAQVLEALALSLWDHYLFQKNKNDLDRIIDIQKRWLGLCPSGHPMHARALGEHAKSLWECFMREGHIGNLNTAIKMAEETLDLCPIGHPDHEVALTELAVYIKSRYQEQGYLKDLNKAIDLEEQRLKLCPSNHWDHRIAFQNLALSLLDCYHRMEDHSDVNKAIGLMKKTLGFHSAHHWRFASIVQSLAAAILVSSNSSHCIQQSPNQLQDEAFRTYQLLKKCTPATSLALLKAVQDWVQEAEKYNHSSVLEAYQTLLNTLDHFTSLNSSVDSRHETMQAGVADLANDAFSCATRHDELQMAVELLEQGRGILWNQLARFDISMAELASQGTRGSELGRKFTQLSADLKKHAQGIVEGIDPYWRVQQEWQSVVDKIRRLDGFPRFLLPPCFDDLQHAAEHGPVIIVNASKYDCDALIVLQTGPPIHVSLPCSLSDAEQLCLQLLELTRDAHAYGERRESWVKEMLRDLWSSVVEPIASVLQNDVQLPLGSRVWWCPTSKFTTLPLHAAGPYRKGKKSFMDLYVSSYAPSLSSLIRTRERVCAQKQARGTNRTANAVSFGAVGQARPSAAIKLSELVEVEHEIQRIRNETRMPPDVTFETITGEAATIEGTVQAFRDHRWVHIACHGAQHATKPFDSWFAMGDGKLTLMRIIQERYTNSEFAFLSACHTAVGDTSTPDEVLHLAAGMQFSGFNGVIGTLWRVDDAVAHRFVTRFYQEMFKHPTVDFEHAAVALNTAAVDMADEVSLEKRIVFVHIGI